MSDFDDFELDDLDLDLDLDDVGTDLEFDDPFAAPDVQFGSTAIVGGSAVEAVDSADLIISADGTGFDSQSDFISGTDPYEPIGE